MTSSRIPYTEIERIVDNYHISKPRPEIIGDFLNRMRSSDLTTVEKTEVLIYALDIHEKNRSLYSGVMSGNLSSTS